MSNRNEMSADMDGMEWIMAMSESNPQAVQVLMTMKRLDNVAFHGILALLDDMNIRGIQIVTCVKDVCNGNVKQFMSMVEDASEGGGREKLVEACNLKGFQGFHEHLAVVRGATINGRSKITAEQRADHKRLRQSPEAK